MSLINQMLQDLDARRAAHGVGTRLPNDVRPLPKERASYWPLAIALVLALVLALGVGFVVTRGDAAQTLASLFSRPVPAEAPPRVRPVAAVPPAPPATSALPPSAPNPVVEASPPSGGGNVTDAGLAAPERNVVRTDLSLRMADFIDAPSETTPTATPPARAEKRGASDTRPAARATQSPAAKVEETSASERGAARTEEKGDEKVDAKAVDKRRDGGRMGASPPVIERTPAAGSAHERAESEYRKAIAAVNQGRLAEATDALREALRQEALHVGARQLLVKLLLEARNQDDAIQVLRDGISGQPAQLGWAMSLARLQVERGELEDAWQTLDHSLPAAGSSPDYLGFTANVLQRLGRHDEAAEQYRKATRLAPADGRWWLGLGWCLDAQGNAADAREAFLRARQAGNLSPELVTLIDQKLR